MTDTNDHGFDCGDFGHAVGDAVGGLYARGTYVELGGPLDPYAGPASAGVGTLIGNVEASGMTGLCHDAIDAVQALTNPPVDAVPVAPDCMTALSNPAPDWGPAIGPDSYVCAPDANVTDFSVDNVDSSGAAGATDCGSDGGATASFGGSGDTAGSDSANSSSCGGDGSSGGSDSGSTSGPD